MQRRGDTPKDFAFSGSKCPALRTPPLNFAHDARELFLQLCLKLSEDVRWMFEFVARKEKRGSIYALAGAATSR